MDKVSASRDVWKPYWAAQQRFFKLLCVSLKVRLKSIAVHAKTCAGKAMDWRGSIDISNAVPFCACGVLSPVGMSPVIIVPRF